MTTDAPIVTLINPGTGAKFDFRGTGDGPG